ncbi:MAG TPA: metallophosphoesterase [Candidatus Limnocylindrales bacterium]|nr:metallophosphoesterase [Candidatus Limnocylindrales bacterium]
MTRRLTVEWPDPEAFGARGGAPIRLLAVSDAPDPALEHEVNREALGRLDAIVGCGDLEPSYLGFLADAFHVPLAFVRGNHDRGGQWAAMSDEAPTPMRSGRLTELSGVTIAPFSWPGLGREQVALRNERKAWWDVLRAAGRLAVRRLLRRHGPVLIVSHAPPRGVGDTASDPYHLGYAAYRWLLDRIRPPLWLHGHTTIAAVKDWRDACGPTTVANVTGSVVVELVPPEATS